MHPLKRRDALASLGISSLVLLLFSDAVFRGRVFYERDLQLDWYTQMESFVRSVAAGSWPLWDNSIAFGQPLLADPSAQVLYPLTWLNLLMRPWWYYTVFVVFHGILAGLGLYRLGQRLGLTPLGSLLAAGIWITSGPFVSMVNLWHHLATAAWIPWVLLAADRALAERRLRRTAIWAAVAACQVLAGSGDVCAMTVLLSAGLLATRIEWRGGRAANGPLLFHTIIAASLATIASAAVWLPTLDVARRSSRWNYPQEIRTAWSIGPAALPSLLLPLTDDGLRLLLPSAAPAANDPAPLFPSLYLGLPALGLVAITLGGRGLRWRGPLAASFLAAMLASMGPNTPFLAFVLRVLPPLKAFRYPSKTIIVAALAWGLLAGIGFDAWRKRTTRGDRSERTRVLPGLVLLTSVVVLAGLSARSGLSGPDRTRVAVALGAAAALALLLLGRWNQRASAAALLVLGDLVLAHRGLNRTAPPGMVSFRPAVVDAMASQDHSRVYVYDYQTAGSSGRYLGRDDPYMIFTPPPGAPLETLQVLSQRLYPFPPVGGRWGIEGSYDLDFRGLYPLPLAEMVQALRHLEGTPGHRRLLQLGAVGTVVSLHLTGFEDLELVKTMPSLFPEPVRVLHVPGALSRVYVVGGARIADGGRALASLVDPGFEPDKEVLLPEGTAQTQAPSFRGRARLRSLLPDRVEIDAELDAPGYVVLVDGFDPGWRATVDGIDAPVLRANIAFRAVGVPAGQHRLEMLYRPPAVLWGFLVSAVGIAALATILGSKHLA